MRILIVEDEKKTAAYLHKGLTEQGFIVDVGIDGEEGLLLATTIAYDLIILDVMVPLRDGWSVLKELRRGGQRAGHRLRYRDGTPAQAVRPVLSRRSCSLGGRNRAGSRHRQVHHGSAWRVGGH